MKARTLGIGVALLAIAAFAYAADTFNLKRIPKVGQTFTYTVSMEMELLGEKAEMRGELSEKVVEVKEGGRYVFEQNIASLVAIMDGEEEALEEPEPIRVTMRTSGEVLEFDPEEAESDVLSPLTFLHDIGLRLDKDSYKLGDTWTHEVPADEEEELPSLRLEAEVVARERVLEIDSIKLAFTSVELEGSEPFTFKGNVWIDPTDGSLVKLEADSDQMEIRIRAQRKA